MSRDPELNWRMKNLHLLLKNSLNDHEQSLRRELETARGEVEYWQETEEYRTVDRYEEECQEIEETLRELQIIKNNISSREYFYKQDPRNWRVRLTDDSPALAEKSRIEDIKSIKDSTGLAAGNGQQHFTMANGGLKGQIDARKQQGGGPPQGPEKEKTNTDPPYKPPLSFREKMGYETIERAFVENFIPYGEYRKELAKWDSEARALRQNAPQHSGSETGQKAQKAAAAR